MTLVEVMVAMLIAVLIMTGVAGGLIQSTKSAAGSMTEISVEAAVESYLEQMQSMPLSSLITPNQANNKPCTNPDGTPNWAAGGIIPTQKTNATQADDVLEWSNSGSGNPTIPSLSTFTPGITPAGVVDNLKEIPGDPNNPGSAPTGGWAAIWPKANLATANVTNPAPKTNNLHMNVWVWITDLSAPTPGASTANPNGNVQSVYGITVIYTWQSNNGFGPQYHMGVLHCIRSNLS